MKKRFQVSRKYCIYPSSICNVTICLLFLNKEIIDIKVIYLDVRRHVKVAFISQSVLKNLFTVEV